MTQSTAMVQGRIWHVAYVTWAEDLEPMKQSFEHRDLDVSLGPMIFMDDQNPPNEPDSMIFMDDQNPPNEPDSMIFLDYQNPPNEPDSMIFLDYQNTPNEPIVWYLYGLSESPKWTR